MASPDRTAPPAPTAPTAHPLQAIAGFAALLRDHGLDVGVVQQQAMVRAVLALKPPRESLVAAAWRSIACHDARSWRRWPELFERYWHADRVRGSVRVSGKHRPSRDLREVVSQLQASLAGDTAPQRPGDTALDAAVDDRATPGESDDGVPRAQGGASRTEALHDRSLSQWLPQDLALLQRHADRIAARLRRRLTRRWRADVHGRRLDLRRTLRASLRTGGVPVAPAWRVARREQPRLFLLVDVSRSMETHAQLFLRIARAFVVAARARVFIFHTRLAEITPLLQSDSASVQEKINAVTAGFGGGTRIAASVADFVGVHARAQLGRSARVWLLSDGFDADPPDELAQQLEKVRHRGARITWFHPSAAPPASQAVQGCTGLIDRFVRLNSLRDLAQAATLLQ